MSQFEDMRAETADAPSASDFLVRSEAATADYGVAQVDNATELGAMQSLGTDLQSASNMAQALSTDASLAHGAVRTLRSVNEEGERLPAVGGAVVEEAKQGILDWLKQRPEAAWRFLKRETLPAWDIADVSEEAGDAAATAEGNADLVSGAKAVASAPGMIDRARGALHGSATGRLSMWDNKAVRQQNKADKIARRIEDAGSATGIAKFRQRFHQSKADRLRGEGSGVLGGVLKARRKKGEIQAVVTRRGFLVAAAGGIVVVPLLLGTVTSCVAGALGGVVGALGGSEAQSGESLNAVESQVASFLLAKGLDPLHVAAIMGNMYGESSMDPGKAETGGSGIGICQWSGSRADALRSYASSLGKDWSDLATQLDFLWDHDTRRYTGNWSSTYVITDSRVNEHPGDPSVGDTVSGSKSGFESASDLDEAVEQFCYGWESPGVPRLAVRKEAAQRYYLALSFSSGGTGQDYASATDAQKAVVDACRSTPSPGAGRCAAWVSNVMSNAGFGGVGGNADEMYYSWCSSSNRSDLKVGMIIAVDKYLTTGYAYAGYTPDGRKLSFHVGIYIGDNTVMDNIGNIRSISLDEWISTYGNYSVVKWGWANGIDLSAR